MGFGECFSSCVISWLPDSVCGCGWGTLRDHMLEQEVKRVPGTSLSVYNNWLSGTNNVLHVHVNPSEGSSSSDLMTPQ